MFCNQCGTELAREAVFCHICGAPRIGDPQVPAEANEPELPAPVAAPAVGVAVPSRPSDGVRAGIAIGAAIGAALILVGTFLPWIDGLQQSGFRLGYVTDPGSGESGVDGVITLTASLVAIGLALTYLYRGGALPGFGMILSGLVAGIVGGYNFGKLIDYWTEDPYVSASEALGFLGEGLFLIIAGGIVLFVTGFAGLGAAQASRGLS